MGATDDMFYLVALVVCQILDFPQEKVRTDGQKTNKAKTKPSIEYASPSLRALQRVAPYFSPFLFPFPLLV